MYLGKSPMRYFDYGGQILPHGILKGKSGTQEGER